MNENQNERKNFVEEIKGGAKKTSQAVWVKSIGFLLAGFGLVAGLAWNDAIQALFKELFPLDKNSLIAKFLYAFIITVVVVIVSLQINKKDSNE